MERKVNKIFSKIVAGLCLIVFVACSVLFVFFLVYNAKYETSGYVFGGYYDLKIYGKGSRAAGREIIDTITAMDNELSTQKTGSAVKRLNETTKKVEISSMAKEVLEICKEQYAKTNHIFNPASYPLTKMWLFSPDVLPSYQGLSINSFLTDQDIIETLSYCDFDDFTVTTENNKFYLNKAITENQIDFGAILKGFACDKAKEILERHNIDYAFVDIGRNLYLHNKKNKTENWNIGFVNPRANETSSLFGKVGVNSSSVVTSGDYEKYYYLDDERVCHIMDMRTGKPKSNSVVNVTVVGKNSSLCEVYSTTIMVLGLTEGINFINSVNSTLAGDEQYKVIILQNNSDLTPEDKTDDIKNYYTNGLVFTLLDAEYVLYE